MAVSTSARSGGARAGGHGLAATACSMLAMTHALLDAPRLLCASGALVLIAACSPADPPAAPVPPSQAPAQASVDLSGHYRVRAIDGEAPATTGADARGEARLTFGAGVYGGSVGCNAFGGLGLGEGGRYYTAPGPMTVMGCPGPVGDQEMTVVGVLAASPAIERTDAGFALSGAGHRVDIEQVGEAAPANGLVFPLQLAGARWVIRSLDGEFLPQQDSTGRFLAFDVAHWRGRAACATLGGTWRQTNDRIAIDDQIETTEQLCPADEAALDDKLADLLRASPRVVGDVNGTLLIGGGGHWLIADADITGTETHMPTLQGAWRIVGLDGETPRALPDAGDPHIRFDGVSLAGSTGCNSFSGIYISRRGRLFVTPPIQTQMGCGDLTAQERRIVSLLSQAPRVARESADVWLLDDKGGLRLAPDGGEGVQPDGTRQPKLPLRAEALLIDGAPVQQRYSDPESWLRLGRTRWSADVGCGEVGGDVRRRGETFNVFTDPSATDPVDCAEPNAARHQTLLRFMNGSMQAIADVNGRLLLAGDRHWLTGQIVD